MAPGFEHFDAASLPAIEDGGLRARVIAGSSFGQKSPVGMVSEWFYAEVILDAGVSAPLDADHEERAIYVTEGEIEVAGDKFEAPRLLIFRPGDRITVTATRPSRLMFLGGAALEGPRYPWWNFVSSRKERIEEAKEEWKTGKFALIRATRRSLFHYPRTSGRLTRPLRQCLQLGRPPEQSHFALALQHCHMAAGTCRTHRSSCLCRKASAQPPWPQGSVAWQQQLQRTVTPTRTSSFAPPIFEPLVRGCLFESGQTKALSVMIYDNRIRPGNIAPEVANERGIVIQFEVRSLARFEFCRVRLLERKCHSGLWRGRAWKTSIRNSDAPSSTAVGPAEAGAASHHRRRRLGQDQHAGASRRSSDRARRRSAPHHAADILAPRGG